MAFGASSVQSKLLAGSREPVLTSSLPKSPPKPTFQRPKFSSNTVAPHAPSSIAKTLSPTKPPTVSSTTASNPKVLVLPGNPGNKKYNNAVPAAQQASVDVHEKVRKRREAFEQFLNVLLFMTALTFAGIWVFIVFIFILWLLRQMGKWSGLDVKLVVRAAERGDL